MLPLLAAQWNLLLARAMLAVALGLFLLLWPAEAMLLLPLLFSAYALAEGAAAFTLGARMRQTRAFAALFSEAVVDIAAGSLALGMRGLGAGAMLTVIGAWSLLRGAALIAFAAVLREELTGEWPLPLAGLLSFAAGGVLLYRPGAASMQVIWTFGVYAFLVGISLMALAVRMRQLALEIRRA
jgi:uncharacterized membrane protein HdeD (DUF308 family)